MCQTAFITIVCLLLQATLTPAAQVSTAAQPSFRSGIDLIQVDVSVLAADGQPLRGLTSADFTILEDGQARPIASFAAVDIAPPASPPAVWMADVPPDVVTNVHAGRRVLVIAIDDASLSTNGALSGVQKTRSLARTIVKALGPDDLVAVIFTEHADTAQNFTTDRRRLLAAIDTSSLFPASSRPDSSDPVDNTRPGCPCGLCSIEALQRAVEGLVSLRQQRKTILYISPGVSVSTSMSEFVPLPSAFSTFHDSCEARKHDAMLDLFRRAQLANVTISAVDPNGLLAGGGHSYPEFLRTVAENTGGRAVVNDNEPERQIPGLLVESSAYYLLGFEPAAHKADGSFHRLQVKVRGRDVRVRARGGYYAQTAKERKAAAQPDAPTTLDKAISSQVPSSDLPMQISVAPFADNHGKAVLAIALSVTQPATAAQGESVAGNSRVTTVDVLASVFDSRGKSFGSRRLTLRLGLNSAGRGDLLYEILPRLPIAPGRYEVRLAVRAEDGRIGSVYTFVDVPEFARAPLSVSGLIVAASPRVSTAPLDAYVDLLPLVPTARRVFRSTDRVTVLARGYEGGARPVVPATVTMRIVDAANHEIVSDTRLLNAESFDVHRSADYRVDLPVNRLSIGHYLLTVDVAAASETARRTLRFQVR